MFEFLGKALNNQAHQISKLESVIEEQAKMLDELRDVIQREHEHKQILKETVKTYTWRMDK